MDQKVGLTAGIVALLALAAHMAVPTGGQKAADQGESQGKTKKGKTAPAAGASEQESFDGPWLATRHFLMPYGQPPPVDLPLRPVNLGHADDVLRCAGDESCRSDLRGFFGLEPDKDGMSVKCLLAIVPDPFHTRLALATDRSIEGIQKGAVAAGWEFAAEWLPWSDAVDPDEGDPEERTKERRHIRVQESQPGVMVFRTPAGSQRWRAGGLAVFVVGETPTAGVNPSQFQIARAYMEALDEAPETVKIDGPTFSGSLYSLAFLIQQDQRVHPRKKYKIRSGTVQSLWDKNSFMQTVRANVEFHSAIADVTEQDRHFRKVLTDLGIRVEQAAVLSEDETAFGRAANEAAKGTSQKSKAGFRVENQAPANPSPRGPDQPQPFRSFRFPRDISHLRDAYRQQQAPKPENAPASGLDFSMKDPGIGEDTVPAYAQTQTPLSQNGVINEIARAIRRFDIRIVDISASNVLDTLFLAGALRRQCPDTRLLVQSADLLFVQAEQAQPLDGMLFLADYPLFAESKVWADKVETAVFPDTFSEGVFNATTLLLLCDAPQCSDSTELRDALVDYGWEPTKKAAYPPEWLMTLDRRGFMPVRVWAHDEKVATKNWFEPVPGPAAKPDFSKLPAPQIWTLISGAFAVLGVVLGVWMVLLRRYDKWQVDARFEPMSPAPPTTVADRKDGLPSECSWHGFYLLLLLSLLLAIQLGIFAARLVFDDWLHLTLMAIGFLLPAGVAIRYCRLSRATPPTDPPSAQTSAWRKKLNGILDSRLAACLAAAFVLAGVAVWTFCCLRPGSQGQLFSFRAAELRFGSSPLWPILSAAAALLLWCFVHVTRLYLASRGQPYVVSDGVEVLKGHLDNSHKEFKASAESAFGLLPGQWRGFWIALVAFAAICALSRVDIQLGSIDGSPYDTLSIALPLLVSALLLLTCWHVRSLWKSLHRFTTNLELLPAASAFVPVSPSSGNRPIWVRHSDLLSLDVHTNSVLVLHDLELHRGKELTREWLSETSVTSWYGSYRDQLASLLKPSLFRTRREVVEEHQGLWRLSETIATPICKTLMHDWQSEPLVKRMAAAVGSQIEEQTARVEEAPPTRKQAFSATTELDSVRDLGERFVALHYTPFLLYGVRQIKNLFWFPSIGFVLLMFSMNSYNFQAPHWIGMFLLVLFAIITWTLGRCIVQMERDPILSRIAGTKPGQLSAGFYLKLAQYGALPVLGLLAHQFPAISNTLLSGIQPALEALK